MPSNLIPTLSCLVDGNHVMKPCWDCGSTGKCYNFCGCAKCVDPEGYKEWRENNPDEYQDWLDEQREDD
ncbi:MAG: hypothetical protein AAB922_04425 [Patescibacteria group bacterium]